MRNCRRSTMMTLAFAVATMMSACSEESNSIQDQSKENVTGVKFALEGSGDTASIEFTLQRVSCDGEPITPWSKVENVPLSGSSEVLTDYFVLLEPGCYDVTAQPLNSSGTPSLDCSAGYVDQLIVVDGTTTEAGIQIQCEGVKVGAADLWVVLNTPPHLSQVTFDPSKFVSHCGVQTVCVEFTDPDGNPVETAWEQISGANLAAGPTPGPIQYDPITGKSTQCATLEHAGPGTVGLEVTAFDMRPVPGGGFVRVEDYYASMGLSIQSRDSIKFPSHGTIGENCACSPMPEICDIIDNDCDKQNNEDANCVCLPFETDYCYGGPPGTAGVGECRSGGRPCLLDGSGHDAGCYEEVLPRPEQCNGKDDDCDGHVDEGLNGCNPVCVVPSSQACVYTGPAGTENVGECQAGAQICLAGGQWSVCTGEVLPATEVPGNSKDDDCDGQVDEPDCNGEAAGTLVSQSCNGVALVGTYADGNCGFYTQEIDACSEQCGASAAGTLLGQTCGWPTWADLYGTYSDGNCGTYTQVIEYNSQTCTCPNPLPAGTLISESCSGYALVGSYADGNCGTYSAPVSSCSTQCGAPPAGTQLSTPLPSCVGVDLTATFADGNCGSYTQVIEYNSAQCCPAAGTDLGAPYCSGNGLDLYVNRANGSCGYYTVLHEICAQACNPPAAGTFVNQFCSGPDLWGTYANGNCGTYPQVIQTSSPQCDVCGDGLCSGDESSATCPTDCGGGGGGCEDGCFESDASGNYQFHGPHDAWKVCTPGGGYDFYLCSDALACADYPAGCTYGGWHP